MSIDWRGLISIGICSRPHIWALPAPHGGELRWEDFVFAAHNTIKQPMGIHLDHQPGLKFGIYFHSLEKQTISAAG